MRKFFKAIITILAGFFASWALYPYTHGDNKRIPELAGITVGCMLIATFVWWMFEDEKEAAHVLLIETLIGSGVAANRLRMEFGAL